MTTFDQLGLSPSLPDAISKRDFVTPTPLQAEMICFFLTEERDVTGLAQTGTGKTAGFGLSILQTLDQSALRFLVLDTGFKDEALHREQEPSGAKGIQRHGGGYNGRVGGER